MSTAEVYSPGLEGVIAGETAISTVVGGLRYRGYPVTELAEHATFDEVAHLLLHGDLPTAKQLADFQKRLSAARKLPEPLTALLKSLPRDAVPMDVVRTSVSILAHFDPETNDNSRAANLRKAERLLAQIPLAVADAYRISKGQAAVPPRPDLGHAANFLFMLRGVEAKPADVRALDVSLILYAEHEFNASDIYGAGGVLDGVGFALVDRRGDWRPQRPAPRRGQREGHGPARAAGGQKTAEKWLRDAMARKERLMGFGHRVYKTGDVRARVLKEYAARAAAAAGLSQWEETAEIFETILAKEKNLFPNLDWPAGRLYHALGLEVPLYTPIFVISRVTGWSAHVIEQLDHNRLIRPRARYTGPEVRTVQPLAQRGG